MNTKDYHNFTEQLNENVKQYAAVKGLIAVGSMACIDYQPDEWSDHDFFLIVEKGHQQYYRTNMEWLPHHKSIAFHFQETEHGVKVVYNNGHLLEFAVFDVDELFLAKVNRYRILLDRCDIRERMEKIRQKTEKDNNNSIPDNKYLAGQFLTNLLVGVGRFRRGEAISANFFIKQSALENLLKLIIYNLPSPKKDLLDNINHRRRFEFVYPEIGKEIDELLNLSPEISAKGLLEIYNKYILPVTGVNFPKGVRIFVNFIAYTETKPG